MATSGGISIVTSTASAYADAARVDGVAAFESGQTQTARSKTSIASISMDALIEERVSRRNQVTRYPVEDGYPVTDNIRPESETLEITARVTGSIVLPDDPGGGISRLIDVCDALRSASEKRDVVTVVTGLDTYSDMAIEAIEFDRGNRSGFLSISATLVKIRKVALKMATVPKNVAPKVAGKTGKTAGSSGAITPKDEPLQPSVLKGGKDAATGGGSVSDAMSALRKRTSKLMGTTE